MMYGFKSIQNLIAISVIFALIAIFSVGCTSIGQRSKSPTAFNREEPNHFFVYRGVKRNCVFVGRLFNPPPKANPYDAPGIEWQLMGVVGIFDMPFSAIFDTFALPFDIGEYEKSIPDESIADYFDLNEPQHVRIYKVFHNNIRARGTRVYDIEHKETLKLLGETLAGIPAEGVHYIHDPDSTLNYRVEITSARRKIILEIRDDYLIAPKLTPNRYYGETYGRECLVRRLAENAELIKEAKEIANPMLIIRPETDAIDAYGKP